MFFKYFHQENILGQSIRQGVGGALESPVLFWEMWTLLFFIPGIDLVAQIGRMIKWLVKQEEELGLSVKWEKVMGVPGARGLPGGAPALSQAAERVPR